MAAPTKDEMVGVLGLSGQWYICKVTFSLDIGDHLRVFYPTIITIGRAVCRMWKPTRNGRMLYGEIVE